MFMDERMIHRQLERRYVTIREVDMVSGRYIDGQDNTGAYLRVSMQENPALTAIPAPGEIWEVSRRGVDWVLERRLDVQGMEISTEMLQPGDYRIEAPNDLYLNGRDVIVGGQRLPWYIGETPPTSPRNNDIWIYTGSGIYWQFMYDESSVSHKWWFVGGAPLFSEVTDEEETTSFSYTNLFTPGPSVALPFAGDYDVGIGMLAINTMEGGESFMSYAIGDTPATDIDCIEHVEAILGGGIAEGSYARYRRKTNLPQVTLTAKYKRVVTGTATFGRRWMMVTPVRVSEPIVIEGEEK
jgi:hypothetical protein